MSGQTGPGSVTRFFGGLLMAVGGLIAVSAGLCSAVLTVGALVDAASSSGDLGELIRLGLPLVLLFGGIPLAVGIVLFFIGRGLYREKPVRPPPGVS